MFDTHTHLNFKRFKKNVDEVITRAHNAGVTHMLIPGTDVESSQRAIDIADTYDHIYASVGIHPHHVFEYIEGQSELDSDSKRSFRSRITSDMTRITQLLTHPKVVAVGECGMDRHVYKKTKYDQYAVSEQFIDAQRYLFEQQIQLAIQHEKSLIIHNREATDDVLAILEKNWSTALRHRTVFHCCEADERLLEFAQKHDVFIGVDGDVTYDQHKKDFIKKVPLEMIVSETDSPFLLPEPLRSQKKYPNEPKNIELIVEKISEVKNISASRVREKTTVNALQLFGL